MLPGKQMTNGVIEILFLFNIGKRHDIYPTALRLLIVGSYTCVRDVSNQSKVRSTMTAQTFSSSFPLLCRREASHTSMLQFLGSIVTAVFCGWFPHFIFENAIK